MIYKIIVIILLCLLLTHLTLLGEALQEHGVCLPNYEEHVPKNEDEVIRYDQLRETRSSTENLA